MKTILTAITLLALLPLSLSAQEEGDPSDLNGQVIIQSRYLQDDISLGSNTNPKETTNSENEEGQISLASEAQK